MIRRRDTYLKQFDKYRVTRHGPNPWTNEALRNVAANAGHFENAVMLLEGEINSGFRCQRVNTLVKGAANSRHMRGLALDIAPGIAGTIMDSARLVWKHAVEGDLGMVQQVICEPSWVHIGWYAVDEEDLGLGLLKQRAQGGYEILEKWTG